MFESLNRAMYLTARTAAWVGMLFLLGAMGVTVADIVLRKTGAEGIFGAVDIVQLMIIGAAFLAIPYGFANHSHVAVSLLVDRFGPRGTALSAALAAVLSALLMAGITWFGYEQAMLQMSYGDVSLTLGIPKVYYWVPLLAGSLLSVLVCTLQAVEALHRALTGRSGVRLPGEG